MSEGGCGGAGVPGRLGLGSWSHGGVFVERDGGEGDGDGETEKVSE